MSEKLEEYMFVVDEASRMWGDKSVKEVLSVAPRKDEKVKLPNGAFIHNRVRDLTLLPTEFVEDSINTLVSKFVKNRDLVAKFVTREALEAKLATWAKTSIMNYDENSTTPLNSYIYNNSLRWASAMK